MVVDESRCDLCATTGVAMTISVRTEGRTTRGGWGSGGVGQMQARCSACYRRVAGILALAGAAAAARPDLLGMPFSRVMLPDDRHCDYCNAELAGEATIVEVAPTRTSVSTVRPRMREQRLCRLGSAWVRLALAEPSGERGIRPEPEGAPGGWLSERTCAVATVALLPRDDETVRLCGEAMGCRVDIVDCAGGLHTVARQDGLILVGAGKRDRATEIVAALPASERRRVAIVARTDQLVDAATALRVGAGDLLVSPLTPQQVAGAMDRLLDGSFGRERDAITGLPLAGPPRPRYGMDCQQIRVKAPLGEELLTALLLKRFTRGYDRLFAGPGSELLLQVYCPREDVGAVVRRLEFVCGEQVVVEASTGAIERAA
ncbi:MAG: hypothetical protein IT304_05615 [Dehalococcoidia bacterium]|nr:hypothetical protein [Dehalococcoidia bacterium]